MKWTYQGFVRVAPGAVRQVIRQRRSHDGDSVVKSSGSRTVKDGAALPIRSIVANRRLYRGERIAFIPISNLLNGHAAYHFLQQRVNDHFASQDDVSSGSSSTASAGDKHESWERFLKRLVAIRRSPALSVDCALWSRDALLLTAMIYLLRVHPSGAPQDLTNPKGGTKPVDFSTYRFRAHWSGQAVNGFSLWVRSWPPRVPSLGVAMGEATEASNSYEEMKRRFRIGDSTLSINREAHAAAQLPSLEKSVGGGSSEMLLSSDKEGVLQSSPNGSLIKDQTNDLLVAYAETHGVHALAEVEVEEETVPTVRMRKNFFLQEKSALTPRQHTHQERQRGDLVHQMGLQYICTLNRCVEDMLRSLLDAMVEAGLCRSRGPRSDDEPTDLLHLQWAHFMLRSRAVNLTPPLGDPHRMHQFAPYIASGSTLVVIPFVDMLNHSFQQYNVSFTLTESSSMQHRGQVPNAGSAWEGVGVVVSAARDIEKGEELTLHYGNVAQRSVIASEVLEECRRAQLPTNSDTSSLPVAEIRRERQTREEFDGTTPIARKERLLRFHAQTDKGVGDAFLRTREVHRKEALDSLTQSFMIRGARHALAVEKAQRTLDEAEGESEWLWRFGFARSEAEALHEASLNWSSGLRERVKRLTDARRRGRPGEFVIGVPEGLQYLREQRQHLVHSRYNGIQVFPPQGK